MAYESSGPSADHRVDSGYSSLTSTPANDTSSETSPGRFKLFATNEGDQVETCARRLFSPRPDLVCFETPLDDATLEWFGATSPRVEQLLVEFLKSGRQFLPPKFKPIAVRLMVLGGSEASARPHLVVFSPPKGSKKIEKFFAREEVKDLLIPTGSSTSVAVVVAEHTKSFLVCLISDIKALCSSDITDRRLRHTLCGLPIVINSRRMTLGGIVGAGPAADGGKWTFYGLTVAHFADGDGESVEDSDDESEPESGADDADDDPVHDAPVVRPILLPPFTTTETLAPWEWQKTATLGNIVGLGNHAYNAYNTASPELDWSLVHMSYLLPNYLDAISTDQRDSNYRMVDLVAPRSTRSSNIPFSNAPYRNIVISSGTRGLQRGRLHGSKARVMLGRSETFSNAYILQLETGTVEEGDSGSWVIDPETSEVLGHVVAKDGFGDSYVIPMTDTLNDIKSRLGCTYVGLPTSLDIFSASTALKDSDEVVSSPPRTPKTRASNGPPLDSGYGTNTYCTPCLDLDDSAASPTTTPDMKAAIPTLPPQIPDIDTTEKTTSSSSNVNGPDTRHKHLHVKRSGGLSGRNYDDTTDTPIEADFARSFGGSGSCSGSVFSKSSDSSSHSKRVSSRRLSRRLSMRSSLRAARASIYGDEPRKTRIELFQAAHSDSSAPPDEWYTHQSTHGESSRGHRYDK
ncbi:hypothetical protein B0T14DRAFT_497259 [Immersiella caudata]|uniref:Uncharacterized protein n=1 Tax=Immersiella caudata TaxID=314043 RepID=A0AA39WSP2_9PEZI|nr:hypothetical protein B0T14DRAFT_497259 [Immersiella caudata]